MGGQRAAEHTGKGREGEREVGREKKLKKKGQEK